MSYNCAIESDKEVEHIYVNGVCRSAGHHAAGYGVYYGERPRNVAVALSTVDYIELNSLTNQRAELWAHFHALRDADSYARMTGRKYLIIPTQSMP